ncbi:hypothetical protein [Clostridium sp.]|uniref:hypothetical protein n=1 Tax=Clostridium sp. TaxID=1506 RepID=UPI003216916F
MDKSRYIDYLQSIFSKYFDIEENKYLIDRNLELYGSWDMKFGRTFLSKDKIVDKYECNEHCLVINMDILTESDLNEFTDYMKKCAVTIVKPHKEHKTTYITGIIVTDCIERDSIIKSVEKFNYTKNYKLSFHGWSILRIVVADLNKNEIYSNRASRDLIDNLSFKKVK